VADLDLMLRRSQLRVAYVWRDEVMADRVALEPTKITLGTRGRSTFITPDLGLPNRFAIFRHGSRGYLLTLGAGMTGRMCLGGAELEVAEFLRRGGERAEGQQGSFRATSVAPGDWGVIHLDGRGDHNLFFQYVKADPPLPRATWRDGELLLPAICFAILLHAVFVLIALLNPPARHSMTFPGKREIMAEYLLNRPPPPPEPSPEPQQGEKNATEKQQPAATVGKEGKAGGKGEKPRARAPDPDQGDPAELPAAIRVGLLSNKSRAELRKVRERGGFDEKLGRAIERLRGPQTEGSLGGHGTGTGTGYGPGVAGTGTSTRGGGGTGGGGRNLADVQRHGPIDTGGTRAARGSPGGRGVKEVAVKVEAGEPTGELGGLTAEEILKVVRSRQNAILNCYNRELQRQKGLGGKVVLTWRINQAGMVDAARVRSTTLHNGRVEDCMVRQIQGLRFPQPRGGQVANVRNFPFLLGLR
jgi:periplasmic protein TonB